ncbi:iron complex transport system permease protein [Paenibacillus phyllosphaerae]|uniref:Iron complex transport system permease protein n=1 Tax=Paenibacillus phyllosphaerae TaxID=274593 RepID=A0A7W5ATJ2_9BACL|nr:iron chelate uptake ABC transporter family permease subunit [Paenibacillus phyllosphaerae]MBB3108500.1 iron complex transport system permease protein [Paenibacillus phyllosphaerae]
MTNTTVALIMAGRRQRRRRWMLITGFLAFLSLMLCCAMLMLGNTIYPVTDVVRALLGEKIKGVSFAVETIRLPRMLAGLFAGFAFGIAGATFQTMLRNPLANPNVLGITSGSSVAAVFCIVILHTSEAIVSISSVIAGLATVALIYVLSRRKTYSTGRLILIGIGIEAMLGAVITYLLMKSAQSDVPAAYRWLAGSLNGAQMEELPPLIISVVVLAPLVIALSKQLSLLELGEQSATTLGVHTDRTRVLLIASTVCMIALATSVTGPIAFVAFLAGPIAKRLVGVGFSTVIPAGLIGVILVLASDLIGQFAFETRFPVGVITGILGAPYLIYLLIRMSRKGEF